MNFGINLSFAVKRWPEPQIWTKMVSETFGLKLVQFTFDLIDPWSPDPMRRSLTSQVRKASEDNGVQIESAFAGLAGYTYNNLLHPDLAGRRVSLEWWKRALDVTVEIGSRAIGAPLGGMSVNDARDSDKQKQLYKELLDAIEEITEMAAAVGVERVLVECTPLAREIPYTIEQAQQLMTDLRGRCRVPVKYLIDVGHALYQPLYGPKANLNDWLKSLRQHIGAFHLQNTDFQSDSHWGWPDSRGNYNVKAFAKQLSDNGLSNMPCFLEVVYAFEQADEEVLASITSSVKHCRQQLSA